jgi:hypothetical protein
MRVRAAAQIACAYSRELGRTGVNCNPNCILGLQRPKRYCCRLRSWPQGWDASIDRGAGPFVWRLRRLGGQLDGYGGSPQSSSVIGGLAG